MASTVAVPAEKSSAAALNSWALLTLFAAGLLLRLRLSWITFLNSDEALHYFLAHQPSLKLAYEASLTTAHPPLMILFLHYWPGIGSSEFFLRLPFVIAGTLFCWVMFLWVCKVASTNAAWYSLALLLFLPSLISLSAEIRQYSFLLLFCSCCLYFLERAIEEDSTIWMTSSVASLYLALLAHYSGLIFAAAVGTYALLRLAGKSLRLKKTWIAGQIGAVAILAFLFKSQISNLRQSGLPSEIAATWLRSSIFQHGQDHIAIFAWSRTLRLFRFFFSQGTIGVLGSLLFAFAIVTMFWPSIRKFSVQRRDLPLLLLFPFLITIGAALIGAYPYGGSRHDIILAIFAIPAIAIGLDRLPFWRFTACSMQLKSALLAVGLVVCYTFPSPVGPYINPENQRRELMQQAINSLRSLPPHSVIFTDAQGSMVLNYYLCGERMPLPFSTEPELFLKFQCGDYLVLDAPNTQAGFDRSTFPSLLSRAWEVVPRESTIYLFQSGWIDNKENDWLGELRASGGTPRNFGANILICPLSRQPE